MPDQFSKTITSINDVASVERDGVNRIEGASGKRVERNRDAKDGQHGDSAGHRHYSELSLPPKELWDELLEAVRRFNERRDIAHSPYALRIWAQNSALRVQIIHEETGAIFKQTKPIPFSALTSSDLNAIINHLIGEKGVVIDTSR